jgi:hypothetical protein
MPPKFDRPWVCVMTLLLSSRCPSFDTPKPRLSTGYGVRFNTRTCPARFYFAELGCSPLPISGSTVGAEPSITSPLSMVG